MVRRTRGKNYKKGRRTYKKGGVKFLKKCFPFCFPHSRSASPTNTTNVPVPVVGGPIQASPPQQFRRRIVSPPQLTLADIKKMSREEIDKLPPEVRTSMLNQSNDAQKRIIQIKIDTNRSFLATRETALAGKRQDRADILTVLSEKPFWKNYMTSKIPIPQKNKNDSDLVKWTRLGREMKALETEIQRYKRNISGLQKQLDNVGKARPTQKKTVVRKQSAQPAPDVPVSLSDYQGDFDHVDYPEPSIDRYSVNSNSSSSEDSPDYGFSNGAAAVPRVGSDSSPELDLDEIRREYGISDSELSPSPDPEQNAQTAKDEEEFKKYQDTLTQLQSDVFKQTQQNDRDLKETQAQLDKLNAAFARPFNTNTGKSKSSKRSSSPRGGRRCCSKRYKYRN
jgi:hypothetical protein